MEETNLDKLSLDLDIGSSEGLSVDQLTRSRLQFLLGQHTSIMHQVQFADAKAGSLLAIAGVLTLIVAGRDFLAHGIFVTSQLVLTMLVVAICLYTLFPRIPKPAQIEKLRRVERFSWPVLSDAAFDEEAYTQFMRTSDASHLVVSVARSNAANARILRTKYLWLRRALALALIDLALLGGLIGHYFLTG